MTLSPSMLRRHLRAVLLSSTAALASACGGGRDGAAPSEPPATTPPAVQPTTPAAVAGTLTARLVTPYTDDGAILLDITGPAPIAQLAVVAQGAVVHSRANANTTRVAVFGTLGSGALVRFSVPDVNAAPAYSAQVTEASDRTSALRASVTGYQVTISP